MVIKRGDNVKKTYEELEKENAELKRQLEERQIIYEPIANEIIEIFAKYRIEFWEVTGLLALVKLKCQHQNSDKSLG
nr:MAG TPA: Protein phosphatase 1 regulatory subunit SMOOTH MUSCLE CELL, SIGNALING [Caudoviricetes sp.]